MEEKIIDIEEYLEPEWVEEFEKALQEEAE